MNTTERYHTLKDSLPEKVQLIAVSKTKPADEIFSLYEAGHRKFGENKVQELTEKYEQLPKDIEWHFIGHLQTNKVKYIAPFITYIHSIDSLKLLQTAQQEALKNNRIINCLLQLKIASEDSKFGMKKNDLTELVRLSFMGSFPNIRICGLMGMATFTDDEKQIRDEFGFLKVCFQELKENYFSSVDSFKELSMGMSDDYHIAIEEGATMIRVGSQIFGSRIYQHEKTI